VCPRPTPDWQKGIGDFFGGPPRKPEKENKLPESDGEEAGGSGAATPSRKKGKKPAKRSKTSENQQPESDGEEAGGSGKGKKPAKKNKISENQKSESDGEEAGGSGAATSSRKSRPLPAEEEDDE